MPHLPRRSIGVLAALPLTVAGLVLSAQPALADGGPIPIQSGSIDVVHNDPISFLTGDQFDECLTVRGYATSVGPNGENKWNGAFQVVKNGRPINPVYDPRVLVAQFTADTSPGVSTDKAYHPVGNYLVGARPVATSSDTVTFEIRVPMDYRGARTGTLIKAGTPRVNPGGSLTVTDVEPSCPSSS